MKVILFSILTMIFSSTDLFALRVHVNPHTQIVKLCDWQCCGPCVKEGNLYCIDGKLRYQDEEGRWHYRDVRRNMWIRAH